MCTDRETVIRRPNRELELSSVNREVPRSPLASSPLGGEP